MNAIRGVILDVDGELAGLLKIAGADDLIEDTTSSSDAKSSKPDPDIVKAALDAMGLRPRDARRIGDTPYDIEAAARTGIRTIAFRCGGFPEQLLADAVAIYDGPADLLARYEASPLVAPLHPARPESARYSHR